MAHLSVLDSLDLALVLGPKSNAMVQSAPLAGSDLRAPERVHPDGH